ncbi:hypothetical protein NE237_004480 [Protea cynaroides]|uniref:Uncharacterized protein n=1 Tax=Protea cynaroides TaxID=273540 RepID=A0A9Q0KJ11_9MAGN|nr:hypothetical protein NE237_004480 [Protea cynaroides]
MPVSGYEEPGFRPLGRHSSDSLAGVPIKKRRYPFVVPQSPPSQTESPQAVEHGLPEKEQPAESSPNAGDAREVSVIAGTSRSYSPEEKDKTSADTNVNFEQSKVRGLVGPTHAVALAFGDGKDGKLEATVVDTFVSPIIPGNVRVADRSDTNVNFVQSKVKGLVEPTHAVALGFGAGKDDKQEVTVADRSVSPSIPENTEILAQNASLTLGMVEEANENEKIGRDDDSELLKSPRNTGLLLVPNKPMVSAMTSQNSQGSCGKQELINPCSWNLAFAKADTHVKNKSNVSRSAIIRTLSCANRSHWDLNTMMDTWDGSMNDVATSYQLGGVDGSEGAATHDSKPVIFSAGVVFREPESTGVTTGKYMLDKNEYKSKLHSFSNLHDQQSKSDDLLNLHLSPSGLQLSISQGQSCMPRKVDSGVVETNLRLSGTVVSPASKLNLIGCSIVKSEPFDEVNKKNFGVANPSSVKVTDARIVKSEPLEDSHGSPKLLNFRNMRLRDHGIVNSEPVDGSSQEILKAVEEIPSQLEQTECNTSIPIIGDESHCLENSTGCMKTHTNEGMSHPLGSPTSLVGLAISADVSRQSDFPFCRKETPVKEEEVTPEPFENVSGVNTGVAFESVGPDAKEANTGDVMVPASETKGLDGVDPESSRLRSTGELHPNSYQRGEVAESDEEKIDIPADMLEDDPYDTDYESDGNHAMGVNNVEDRKNVEDDDYEDGEVREPLGHKDDPCEEIEIEHIDYGESENKDGGICYDHVTTSVGEDGGVKVEELVESKNAFCGGEYDFSLLDKNDQHTGEVETLQESVGLGVLPAGSGKKGTLGAAIRKSVNHSGRQDGSKGDADFTSNHSLGGGEGTATGDGQCDAVSQQEHDKGAEPGEMNHLVLPKAEPSKDGDEATNDTDNRGAKSRIINLPRVSCGPSSSSRVRTAPGRSLPSRTEKERFSDVVLRGDKIHNRGNRDEGSIDGSHKFERVRNQGQAVRNSRSDFMHGRGRVDNRLDTSRGGWDSDRDFGPEHYNGPTGFRLPRSTNAAAVAAAKLECSGFIVAPDGTVVGQGRGGRKPLNDELTVFHHPLSRRRSPVGREGPCTRVVRRPPRDVSPDRCTGGAGHDLVGLRHEDKFLRGMPDDVVDTVFSRSQPQFERLDPFLIGDRSFSPIQRRGPPRVPQLRSKSPPRSRSPGPWSSPRRSPDGFDGRPAMTRRRSPPVYRMDRMRIPHHRPCFADDMSGRRHGSPPYMSRVPDEMRDMGSSREQDHPRAFIPNRSLSGRVLPRNNRRFDMIDPRQRTETDEYFGGPMHSSRFHELGNEGGVDERRKCNERRGPVRSFRPPYNGTDVENFRFHFEDGPRPYRFCPEADANFHERGGLREREFDSRFKSCPGNAHGRTRTIEEQEENYMHGGQGWNDAGFDDVARAKRRRF